MEQEIKNNQDCQLGSQELSEFTEIMDALFPEQDLSNPDSIHRKKLLLTFSQMQAQNWTREQFQKTIQVFGHKWTYHSWMPANILEIWKRMFGEPEMVI
jgi:hypothetical protein